MTCIVAIKNNKNNKIYMGGDRRIHCLNDHTYYDKMTPKILNKDGFSFGFFGNLGVQDFFENHVKKDFSNYSFEDMLNLINIFKIFSGNGTGYILCNKQNIGIATINTLGDTTFYKHGTRVQNDKNDFEFLVGGMGFEVVAATLAFSEKDDPKDLINEAINCASNKYPSFISKCQDIFEI